MFLMHFNDHGELICSGLPWGWVVRLKCKAFVSFSTALGMDARSERVA